MGNIFESGLEIKRNGPPRSHLQSLYPYSNTHLLHYFTSALRTMPLSLWSNVIKSYFCNLKLMRARQKRQYAELINILPPEILGEIFIFLAGPDAQGDSFNPLALLEVCTYWRELALSTSQLWTTLAIKPLKYSEESLEVLANGIETWFSRSGPRQISFSLFLDRQYKLTFDHMGLSGRLPWSRMVNLELRDRNLSSLDILQILHQSPELATLSVCCRGFLPDEESKPVVSTTLLHLKALRVDFSNLTIPAQGGENGYLFRTKVSKFFDALALPSLEGLEVRTGHRTGTTDEFLPETLTRHQLKNNPPLKYLDLRAIFFNPVRLYEFFLEAPDLEMVILGECKLKLDNRSHRYPQLLRMLTFDINKDKNPLPKLDVLVVYMTGDSYSKAEGHGQLQWIKEMRQSRQWEDGEYSFRQPGLKKIDKVYLGKDQEIHSI